MDGWELVLLMLSKLSTIGTKLEPPGPPLHAVPRCDGYDCVYLCCSKPTSRTCLPFCRTEQKSLITLFVANHLDCPLAFVKAPYFRDLREILTTQDPYHTGHIWPRFPVSTCCGSNKSPCTRRDHERRAARLRGLFQRVSLTMLLIVCTMTSGPSSTALE